MLDECRRKDLRNAQEVNRAHILVALDAWSHGDLANASGILGGRPRACVARRPTSRYAAHVRNRHRGRVCGAGMFQTARWCQALPFILRRQSSCKESSHAASHQPRASHSGTPHGCAVPHRQPLTLLLSQSARLWDREVLQTIVPTSRQLLSARFHQFVPAA